MIKAFITNLGKYNEGALIGEWVKFPTTREELGAALDRIGIGAVDRFGCVYEEFFITDYECDVSGVVDVLGEHEMLDELNYLAERLDELRSWELDVFEAALELDSFSSAESLINLTYDLDNYTLFEGVRDADDLGRYWVNDSGCYDTKSMGILGDFIDYEAFGEYISSEETSCFTSNGYICKDDESSREMYNGYVADIPEEYLVYTKISEEEDE